MDYETVRVTVRQCFPELLQGPLGRRMVGNPVMKDLAATQFHGDEYIHRRIHT